MITARGRTYVRDQSGPVTQTTATILPLHGETTPGSDIWTVPINLEAQRFTLGDRDGWRVVDNGWHFALGNFAGPRPGDGWIGYGGRGGQHWLWSRLQGIGYLHGPTRTWRDLGGPPTFNRANLTTTIATPLVIGGETFRRKGFVRWADLWPNLPLGRIDLELAIRGHGLKEFLRVNAAARRWIATNRPPLTPLNETWFGFLWEIDWTDIPQLWQGTQIGRGDDVQDANGQIEMRTALGQRLGLILAGRAWIENASRANFPDEGSRFRPALQRFFGGNRLLIGLRLDHLAAMAPGDLIIDPPQVTDTATLGDDGYEDSTDIWQSAGPDNYLSGSVDNNVGMRFQMAAMNANTVTASSITWDWGADQSNVGVFDWTLRARDVADAPAYSNTSLPSADFGAAGTTASVNDSQTDNPTVSASDTSPSLNAIFQELVDSYGDTINNVRISWDAVTADGDFLSVGDAEAGGTVEDPLLSVTQSAGGGGSPVFRLTLLGVGR